MFTIAIIGRPNVGKSRLFNRLSEGKKALVNNIAGLTRDRKEEKGSLLDLSFSLIDTAGLEDVNQEKLLESEMMKQTNLAVQKANLIYFLIDMKTGITNDDIKFAKYVRRLKNNHKYLKIICVGNKCDSQFNRDHIQQTYQLGLGEPVLISAEHGLGLEDLYYETKKYFGYSENKELVEDSEKFNLQIAIIGRPNVGKSTFFNAVVGEERSITSNIPGTTRDAVYVDIHHKKEKIRLIDTAGLRKNAKKKDISEEMSISESVHALQFANIAFLVIDGCEGLKSQDLNIAENIVSEGRGMVLVVNKADKIENVKYLLEEIEYKISESFAQIKDVPIILASALEKENIKPALNAAVKIYQNWNKRISTGVLNNWLKDVSSRHLTPLKNGKRFRFRYVTQIKTRPPTFALFTSSNTKNLPESYLRYLSNSISKNFGLEGVPVRMLVRKQSNPYEKKK